nr:MAG TPA: hypothetical protein [Caudoviricetes sp.]
MNRSSEPAHRYSSPQSVAMTPSSVKMQGRFRMS